MARSKSDATQAVSPRALAWARTRAQLSTAEVAAKLDRKTVDAATIKDWERGVGGPTEAQVRDLADIFRIPERWLSYPEPPPQFDALGIIDFRTNEGRQLDTLSLNLRSTIEHAHALQAWVVDHRAHAGEVPVALVGAKSDRDSAKHVAEYLRDTLEVERIRAQASDADEFFKQLRQQLEELGVLVLRMGQVANKTAWALDPTEFKGFTLIDEDRLAPLIFINRKDVELFTLAHELAHLVTGGSGVSNEDIEDFADDRPRIERFCDEVAEELLAPAGKFGRLWGAKHGFEIPRVGRVAAQLKVTPLVAGRRAVSIGRASPAAFRRFVGDRREQVPAKTNGGTVYQSYPTWYGRELVSLLAEAATTDHPSGSDALDLLGLTFASARTLADRVSSRRRKPRKELPKMKRFPLISLQDGWRQVYLAAQ